MQVTRTEAVLTVIWVEEMTPILVIQRQGLVKIGVAVTQECILKMSRLVSDQW
jgi:hypothetical protein